MSLNRLQRFDWRDFSPLHRMLTLHEQLDSLFGRALAEPGAAPLDVFEDKEHYLVQFELPGLKKEDITIALNKGVLTVSGERKESADQNTVTRRERALGCFERSVKLPARVDSEKIKAAYHDGILSVTLPKAEEARPKQISVEIN